MLELTSLSWLEFEGGFGFVDSSPATVLLQTRLTAQHFPSVYKTMKEYRDTSNRLSIDLSNVDHDNLFQKYAKILETEFNGKIIEKLDGLDQRYWDFDIEGNVVVIHSDSMVGISIHVEDESNENLLRVIGKRLLKL